MADKLGLKRTTYTNYEGGNPVPTQVMDRAQRMVPRSEISVPLFPVGSVLAPVPLFAAVPATNWEEPDETEDIVELDPKFAGQGRFACRIKGDSMHPFLRQGDLVVFQRSDAPSIGLVILARAGKAVTVKQLLHNGESFVLHCINPHYEGPVADIWSAVAYVVGVIREEHGMEITFFNPRGLRPMSMPA